MTDDIVKRLRKKAAWFETMNPSDHLSPIFREAAAEIERLRKERDEAASGRESRHKAWLAAEAKVAKLRETLLEIADCECVESDSEWMRRHARAALEG